MTVSGDDPEHKPVWCSEMFLCGRLQQTGGVWEARGRNVTTVRAYTKIIFQCCETPWL